jgi:hypothetical protein
VRGRGFGVVKRGIVRRIAAILMLGPTLDANYPSVKQATHDLGKSAKANGATGMHAVRFPCSTFAVLPQERAGIGWITSSGAH